MIHRGKIKVFDIIFSRKYSFRENTELFLNPTQNVPVRVHDVLWWAEPRNHRRAGSDTDLLMGRRKAPSVVGSGCRKRRNVAPGGAVAAAQAVSLRD